jgi:hypothetical protein
MNVSRVLGWITVLIHGRVLAGTTVDAVDVELMAATDDVVILAVVADDRPLDEQAVAVITSAIVQIRDRASEPRINIRRLGSREWTRRNEPNCLVLAETRHLYHA